MTVSSSTGAFARALPALELIAVLLAAPALLFPSPARLILALVVPLVWVCQWLISGRFVPPTPLNASLIFLLGMIAVSLGATFDIPASLGNVSGVLLGTMVFWAWTRWVTTPDRLRTATLAFIVAGCALALVGLLGRLPPAVRGLPGAAGGFHPDAIAGCLVLFVPLQVALLTAARTRRLQEWRLAPFGWLWSTTVQGLLLLLTGGTLLLTAGDVSGRVEIWSRAIYAIQDFPLTGMGMNTFRKVMPVFYPGLLTSPEFEVAHAHNHLLQAALDLGLPGLVAYLSIWLIAAALLVDVYRRRLGVYRVLASGLGTGLIAHFSFSMTDAIPLGAKLGILFWLTLALVVSLHRVSLSEAPGEERSRAEPAYSENPA